jgi:N-acetylglucosamine-6-phosphate deacetylase
MQSSCAGSGRFVALVVLGMAWPLGAVEFERTRPVDGLRQNLPRVYALVGAKLIVAPNRVIEAGTLVVRDGVIEAVGKDVVVPSDAAQWQLDGKSIYPGLIDAYGEADAPSDSQDQAAGFWNPAIQPQRSMADHITASDEQNQAFRSQGITVRLLAPRDGIIKGQSVVLTTGGADPNHSALRPRAALHVRLGIGRGEGRGQYPGSPMGAVALARQAVYDALWYRDAWQVFQADTGAPRPEQNEALAALQPYVDQQQLVIINTADEQYLLRADRFAREFGLRIALVGSGHEYRRLSDICATGRPVIVPVNFPKPPDVGSPEEAADVSLELLMHWDLAPENPARLQAAGVPIALTSHGLDSPRSFLSALGTAVRRGLSAEDALRALTVSPARLLNIDQTVGTLEPGKLAHLLVTDGPLFEKETKVLETWVDGTRYVVQPPEEPELQGTWRIVVDGRDQTPDLVLSGKPPQLKAAWRTPRAVDATAEEKPQDEPLKSFRLRAPHVWANFDAKAWGYAEGNVLLSAAVVPVASGQKLIGRVTLPDGSVRSLTGEKIAGAEEPADAEMPTETAKSEESEAPTEGEKPTEGATPTQGEALVEGEKSAEGPASFAVNYPLGDYGVDQVPTQPEWLVFRQATVWTCGALGILDRGDVLVHQGRIVKVAEQLNDWPEGTVIVECSGRHLSPGIIDCHSHMATDGGVNEATQAITAEVRIGDFIDANDISIYRQLAGGVTCANILHGSANPIGGQNQVIKLRWGMAAEALKFKEAPPGIKFALGENVKQSNWGDNSTRYPKSRMGVEQIVRDALLAARQYRDRQQAWQAMHQGLPPRHDLELEALAEIVEGKRWIHCHSYRQDEILALLRTLESFGIRIATLQHVLEGYKVAEVLQRHGAMASSFSDWWAYKIEVYDAIPYNGALMHDAGIVVSFNSDDQELARHLNHEAAKAVKYGGVAPQEALKFVTINPARQLRIEAFVGSLEEGKHADVVVWSGPPLSVLSRCEQTWIDGRKYFDYEADRAARARWQEMRAKLVQKILQSGQDMQKDEEREPRERDLWPREDVFCHAHEHN